MNMSVPAQLHPEDKFAKYIRASLIAHVVLLGALVLRAAFFPSEPIIIEHAIKVDMVGLPDKKQAVLPPEPKKEVALPEEVKPAEPIPKKNSVVKKMDPKKVDLRKLTTAEEDAIKRLEAFKKLSEMSKPKPPAKTAPIRGAVLAAGSSITGLNKIDYDDYLEKIDEKVKSNWNLPSLLKNQNLTATVMVYVDGSGRIIKKEVKKSSGNSVFDDKCLEAIELSAPFDSPPLKLTNIISTDGIEFGFPD